MKRKDFNTYFNAPAGNFITTMFFLTGPLTTMPATQFCFYIIIIIITVLPRLVGRWDCILHQQSRSITCTLKLGQ